MPSTASTLTTAFAHAIETSSPSYAPPPSPGAAASSAPSTVPEPAIPEPEQGRFNFVVSDPVAIYYLKQDPCVKVIQPQVQLEGYEIYLVEQWACSRSHPSFTIATYTGHPSHKILVGLLSIDKDESKWRRELADYFRFVKYFGREKKTPLGTLMVTNLSNLSSDLTVIAVPDGDVLKHKKHFIINEDLKRMGCSGRSALTLTDPTDASRAKFHQLFRICDRIPFDTSVIELVRLSQLALVMFQKLDKHFADGLLCDETEKAIKNWWAEFGTDFYNVEPSDGILGPTTVAALLGMVIGARNRLSSCGAPVPKDAFDLAGLKLAIGQFQKQHKLRRTRRLDRETVDKLQKVTMKGQSGDKYGMVSKAIKSTVAEMSGKAQKVEMETCDLEKFIMHLSGERAKYLWYGKPMKSTPIINDISSGEAGPRRNSAPVTAPLGEPGRTRVGGHGRNLTLVTDLKSDSPAASGSTGSSSSHPLSAPAYPNGQYVFHTTASDTRDPLRKAMFKTMNNRMHDAKSGLGKIKDVATGVASGISGQVTRLHQRKQTQDAAAINEAIQPTEVGEENKQVMNSKNATASSAPVLDSPRPSLSLARCNEQEATRSDPTNIYIQKKPTFSPSYDALHTESPTSLTFKSPFHGDTLASLKADYREGISPMSQGPDADGFFGDLPRRNNGSIIWDHQLGTANPSVAGSTQAHEDALDKQGQSSNQSISSGKVPISVILNRSRSFSDFLKRRAIRNEEYYPRRVSFSAAEEAVLDRDKVEGGAQEIDSSPKVMKCMVLRVEDEVGSWCSSKIKDMQAFIPTLNSKLQEISNVYRNDLETYHKLMEKSSEIIPREFSSVHDEIREVELLRPKLQYEISTLQAKVDEVQEWVEGFGRQVEELEMRVIALEPSKDKMGWFQWALAWFSWKANADF